MSALNRMYINMYKGKNNCGKLLSTILDLQTDCLVEHQAKVNHHLVGRWFLREIMAILHIEPGKLLLKGSTMEFSQIKFIPHWKPWMKQNTSWISHVCLIITWARKSWWQCVRICKRTIGWYWGHLPWYVSLNDHNKAYRFDEDRNDSSPKNM